MNLTFCEIYAKNFKRSLTIFEKKSFNVLTTFSFSGRILLVSTKVNFFRRLTYREESGLIAFQKFLFSVISFSLSLST